MIPYLISVSVECEKVLQNGLEIWNRWTNIDRSLINRWELVVHLQEKYHQNGNCVRIVLKTSDVQLIQDILPLSNECDQKITWVKETRKMRNGFQYSFVWINNFYILHNGSLAKRLMMSVDWAILLLLWNKTKHWMPDLMWIILIWFSIARPASNWQISLNCFWLSAFRILHSKKNRSQKSFGALVASSVESYEWSSIKLKC